MFDAAIQNDNIIVLGTFTEVNGINKNTLVRFNSDGELDNSFDVGSGSTEIIQKLTAQPDGKLILSGSYVATFIAPCADSFQVANVYTVGREDNLE